MSLVPDATHRLRLEQLGLLPRIWPTRSQWPRLKRLETVYALEGLIGSGATGHALLARDKTVADEPTVALKLYAPAADATTSEGAEQMNDSMEAEIDALVALHRASGTAGHPNVASYLGRFRWAPEDDGDVPDVLREHHFKPNGGEYVGVVLEYVDGVDLIEFAEQWWERHGETPPPPSLVRQLLRGALGGLSYLHAMGFAHRDIKPSNIRVRTDEMETVILDLGFACHMLYDGERADSLACKRRPYAGSPIFISPELASAMVYSRALSAQQAMASDVWSLGLSFLVLITGAMPHPEAKTMRDVVRSVRAYKEPASVVYALDAEMNRLLRQMLARDWDRRVTATAALTALDRMSDPVPAAEEEEAQEHDVLIPHQRVATLSPAKKPLKRTRSML